MTTKVRKQFLLDPELLRRARESLGARTDTEAVERALWSVAIDHELNAFQMGLARKGLDIDDVFGRLEGVALK